MCLAKISTEYGVLTCDKDHGPYEKHHVSHSGKDVTCPVSDKHVHGTEGGKYSAPNHVFDLPPFEYEWGPDASYAEYMKTHPHKGAKA